jgi:hypothetical protein
MEISPAEIIDRISIVRLKIERIRLPELNKEFQALKNALEDFKKKGILMKEEWTEELYRINKEEWDLLEQMNNERKKGNNYEKIGRIYLQTEEVNKRRAEAKNRIIEETGEGFKEIKKNHPSE